MRRALFVALVIVQTAQAAETPAGRPYLGTVSGETLLRDYVGPPGPRDDPFLKGSDVLNFQMARGFMDGVKDATEGAAWCYVGGKSNELNEDIAAALTKLTPEERKGRAGPLVVDALRRLFPCPVRRTTP
ncbi:Rap1a/Tai family immunity protein [Massilia glaciei]|uniref:Rap1a immunity protein domain-containing protein n=1 Tax=Massilia glaciei TaxID=1524097 RepID=A0A2U2HMR5_9BURK|nr:Rap1a/Tai family immunity protein [Massilia glaciei]PWF48808.1 hypothetical protein C7C56_010065 [Massilia glaciei]